MKRLALCCLLVLSVGLTTACASDGGTAASGPNATETIPASSPLAKIENGMNDSDVRKLLGEPSNINAYMTGKQFIPYYYGSDTSRTDWMYKGVGRVVFSRNRYSQGLKVINVIHNPEEQ